MHTRQFLPGRCPAESACVSGDQVQTTLAALANAKGIDLSSLVNDLLKKDIELIEIGRLTRLIERTACTAGTELRPHYFGRAAQTPRIWST